MLKRMAVILLLALALALSGCGGKQASTQPSTTSSVESTFKGGSEALSIEFMEGSPPAETFDNGEDDFTISVKLENKGEFDVPANGYKVWITGIDAEDFGKGPLDLVRDSNLEEIKGVSLDPNGKVVPGGIQIIDFPPSGSFSFGGDLSGNLPYPVQANVCYEYGTTAVSKLCYEEDLIDPKRESICEANGDRSVENSGSPVQVIGPISESVNGKNKILFIFTVRHVGSGKIFKHGLSPLCDDSSSANENRVNVKVITNMPGKLSCSGLDQGSDGINGVSGDIRLSNRERIISCTQEVSDADLGDFEKELRIELRFQYQHSEKTTLIVKHVEQN